MSEQDLRRRVPAVHRLLKEVGERYGLNDSNKMIELCRVVLDQSRQKLKQENDIDLDLAALAQQVFDLWQQAEELHLKRVVNATGIVIHTNLGRAPLGKKAQEAVKGAMEYCNVEYDLTLGQRGSRLAPIEEKLCKLTGAEAALAVNNNAAALLLVLTGLAKDKEVLISRSQLVEIGGSFRIPDVIASCGAHLVEVGTTNRTYVRDYEQGLTENTALVLKVHNSNYRIVGFTSQPSDEELTQWAHTQGLLSIYDAGSGTLLNLDLPFPEKYHEPTVQEALQAGYDLVTFSGDKLLGSCQGGLVVGKKKIIDALKKHPLMRALRLDKLSLAALEGTLLDYLQGRGRSQPVSYLLNRPLAELEAQAQTLMNDLAFLQGKNYQVELYYGQSFTGGGAFPALPLPSVGIAIEPPKGAGWLESALRQAAVPIIGRIEEKQFILDMRSVSIEQIPIIVKQLASLVEKEQA